MLTSSLQRRAMRNRAKSAEFGENAIQGEIMNLPSKRTKRGRGVGHGRQGAPQVTGQNDVERRRTRLLTFSQSSSTQKRPKSRSRAKHAVERSPKRPSRRQVATHLLRAAHRLKSAIARRFDARETGKQGGKVFPQPSSERFCSPRIRRHCIASLVATLERDPPSVVEACTSCSSVISID